MVSSPLLLYADDAKIYSQIDSISDCRRLQSDINNVATWCHENFLSINKGKCVVIAFSNKRNPIEFNYSVDGFALVSVNEVRDLGVTLDSRLSFQPHISNIMNKSYRNLGFILRLTKDFWNLKCIKYLYFALVRSVLEFASIIWNPRWLTQTGEIEKIQRKFTRVLNFKSRLNRMEYSDRLATFELSSLESRRTLLDMVFFHKFANNLLDIETGNSIIRRTPRYNLRESQTFLTPIAKTSYGTSVHPMGRFLRTYGREFGDVDINAPRTKFKQMIMSSLKGVFGC